MANKLLFHFQSSNDQNGIESFIKHLKQQCPEASFVNCLYCMEHTEIYNNHIISFLQASKAGVWVEHPIHIKESLGMIRGKNDKVDAQRIALYAYKNREEARLWTPKREVIQQLDGWPLPSVDGHPQPLGKSPQNSDRRCGSNLL
ncbi:IS110 family transposase [Spirosoma foliorum]|uniref:IS110 family transposase n=1 Tax=Spirosoma foliorum TaxID=2710596 RepID=UPI001F0B69F6|nr:transposase [Spirosoma foliorum]